MLFMKKDIARGSMLYKCQDSDKNLLYSYIGENTKHCIYPYLDLHKYTLSEPFMDAWLIKSNESSIEALLFRYHNGLHIYATSPLINVTTIISIINEYNITFVGSSPATIKQLLPHIHGFIAEYGQIMKYDAKTNAITENVSIATESDMDEITRLILKSPEIGTLYSFDDLHNQLIERYRTNYSRSYIIRKDGVIVSHASTGAECDKVATVVYVVTDENHRHHGYASTVVTALCNSLVNENKEVFLVCYEQNTKQLYEKLGFTTCCEYGKLTSSASKCI